MSAGEDDINIIILKRSSFYILNSLCHIINQSGQNDVFPLLLESAIVGPILKMGVLRMVENHRPVSFIA